MTQLKTLSVNNLSKNKISSYNDFINIINDKYKPKKLLDLENISDLDIIEYDTCINLDIDIDFCTNLNDKLKNTCYNKIYSELHKENLLKRLNNQQKNYISKLISEKICEGYNSVKPEIERNKTLCRKDSFINRSSKKVEPYIGDEGRLFDNYYYGLYGSDSKHSNFVKIKSLTFNKNKLNVKFQTYITFLLIDLDKLI